MIRMQVPTAKIIADQLWTFYLPERALITFNQVQEVKWLDPNWEMLGRVIMILGFKVLSMVIAQLIAI